VAKLGDLFRNPFSFLFTRSQNEDRIAQYVIREHHRGRPLGEILEDNYVKNRCSGEQIQRLLDRPEIVHAIGDDLIAQTRPRVARSS
jgi:hypothetical protein